MLFHSNFEILKHLEISAKTVRNAILEIEQHYLFCHFFEINQRCTTIQCAQYQKEQKQRLHAEQLLLGYWSSVGYSGSMKFKYPHIFAVKKVHIVFLERMLSVGYKW